jgi:hypothetical protein
MREVLAGIVYCININVRCILRVVKRSVVVFLVVTSCSVVSGYQCFGRTHCLHLQKIQAISFCETLVTIYKTARHHNSEDRNQPIYLTFRVSVCGASWKHQVSRLATVTMVFFSRIGGWLEFCSLWVTNQRKGGLLINSRSSVCSEAAWGKHRQPNCDVASSHLFLV